MFIYLLIAVFLLRCMRGCGKWLIILAILGWAFHRDHQLAQDCLDGLRWLEHGLEQFIDNKPPQSADWSENIR